MSKTAFYAGMIKQELERLASRSPDDEQKFGYILQRLWPDLESRIGRHGRRLARETITPGTYGPHSLCWLLRVPEPGVPAPVARSSSGTPLFE
jgi:hypothetical protein